ncbi:MAG TPA: cbb3-type cytochrome c oxidase subunit II [Verrucomicrobiae bacterium]|nr:cbb3-type cytochrome c oxidase subunit II [Verrucomicrobiae bacterium]
MKSGFRVFVAAFIALGASWCGFVLAPALQLGAAKQTQILNSSEIYPLQRPGNAALGLQVYRSLGCAACHTTQVQQSGFACDVVLTSAGKNPEVVSNLVSTLKLTGLTKDEADSVAGKITAAGGKSETHIIATGSDIPRWGIRRSVAEDFLWDDPVQLGSIRVGPDLANIGLRYDAAWEFAHLYDPKSRVKDSVMPPFRFLFETKNGEVIPTEDAKNLVAYLLSLRADVPLYDAPFTPPSLTK